MSDDYQVGYKKPPKQHQFKKGQSGNPKGRPKDRKPRIFKDMQHVRQTLIQLMEEELIVVVDGKKTRKTALELHFTKLRNQALGGDFRSQKLVNDLYCSFVSDDEAGRLELLEAALESEYMHNTVRKEELKENGPSVLDERMDAYLRGLDVELAEMRRRKK